MDCLVWAFGIPANQSANRAKLIAGGTDLLGLLKDRVLPTYPELLVNIKSIPGLDSIERDGGG